jgi:hypothetical protein
MRSIDLLNCYEDVLLLLYCCLNYILVCDRFPGKENIATMPTKTYADIQCCPSCLTPGMFVATAAFGIAKFFQLAVARYIFKI